MNRRISCTIWPRRTLALFLGAAAASALAQTAAAPASPSTTDDSVIQLSPFEVSSSTDRGYIATRASGATKTNTPRIELPHSIQVLNKEFIEDTGAQNMFDLVRFTGNASGGAANTDSSIQIRGFPVTRLRNGMPFPDSGAFTFDEVAPIERVEVIKGASAVLYGTSAPGGLINIVDKRPLPRQQTEVRLQTGSDEFYKLSIDSTGPLLKRDGLAINYRAIAAYEDSDSWRRFAYRRRSFLSGSLDFRLGRSTTVIQRMDYQKDDLLENYAKPYLWFPAGATQASQGTLLNLPDDFHRGESNDFKDTERFSWETTVEHAFNEDWSARATAVYTDVFAKRMEVFISAQTANINVWPRFWQFIPDDQQQWVTEFNLLGNVEAGPTKHQLLAGFNYFDQDRTSANLRYNVIEAPFNVFNPVYGAGVGSEVTSVRRITDNYTESTGFFIQDQVKLFNDRFHIIVGVRRDQLDQEIVNKITNARTLQTDKKTSPRYGALWRVTPEWTIYVSYNESFTPSPGTVSVQGVPFPTPTAEQLEAGLKFQSEDGRFSGSISVFENTRFNLTTVDVLNPGFSVATGEVQSKGGEIELGLSLLDNWQVIAAAGWQEAKITKDNTPSRVGRLFENTPELSASLWTKYEFKRGTLKGLSFGAGFVLEQDRLGAEGNIQFPLPDYTVFNAMAAYRWDNNRVTLNIENVFDESYITRSSGARFVQVGNPRLFFLSYSRTFR